jgi:hypothetical protein
MRTVVITFLVFMVAILALGTLSLYKTSESWSITRARYDSIRVGMTLAEVEQVLGPGKKVSPVEIPRSGRQPALRGQAVYMWKEKEKERSGREGEFTPVSAWRHVYIGFDEGLVCDKCWIDSTL